MTTTAPLLDRLTYNDATGKERPYGWVFRCPACEDIHQVRVEGDGKEGPTWTFNGDTERPTFTPSVRVRYLDADGETVKATCHLDVTAGRLRYHSDCSHKLADQDIPMVPVAWSPNTDG